MMYTRFNPCYGENDMVILDCRNENDTQNAGKGRNQDREMELI